jgi:hypothetical protein
LVNEYANGLAVPVYQARIRIFERGLVAIFGTEKDQSLDELALCLTETLARLERLESICDRTLYTAASAYTFAAHAAHKGGTNPSQLNETLSQASMDAYRRQLEAARSQK